MRVRIPTFSRRLIAPVAIAAASSAAAIVFSNAGLPPFDSGSSALATSSSTGPATPVITQYPDDPTTANLAHFAFTDGSSNVTFQCQLDGGGYSSCKSPQTYNLLSSTSHTFYVRAVDPHGVASAAASYSWTILANKTFGITGHLSQPLYPGAQPQPLDLTLQNAYNFALQVTSISVALASTNTAGCSTTNFVVSSQFTGTVVIPANTTESLTAAGATSGQLPELQMIDTGTNQDICRGASLALTYSGQAQKA